MTYRPPSYLTAYKNGALKKNIAIAFDRLAKCDLCPRNCKVNRLAEDLGLCKTGSYAIVSSHGPHFGEERPISGGKGSGTIFFAGCNLLCAFCQNSDVSHGLAGEPAGSRELANIMIGLQKRGCHNINFVSPTHVVPQILKALPRAIEKGLNIPLIYNTGSYDSVKTIKLLEGIMDIYMADIKFMDNENSKRFCDAGDYVEVMKEAVVQMRRQVGDLVIENGIARQGLLARHLVMPNNVAGTAKAMEFLASLSTETYVNIMSQYRPWFKADLYPEIFRHPSDDEMEKAFIAAKHAGLSRLDRPGGN